MTRPAAFLKSESLNNPTLPPVQSKHTSMNGNEQSPTPTTPNLLDMKTRLVYWLLMQGLGVVVLCATSYLFWTESRQYREESKACNEQMIQIYQDQNQKLIEILGEIRDHLGTPATNTINTKKAKK